MARLVLRPIGRDEAWAFVTKHHRHHRAPQGYRVAVGVEDEAGELRGVGILGRPVGRGADDGYTAEVTRIATDGTANACSMLYGALCRAAFALGYRTVVTYTLPEEPGTSLRASGWRHDGLTDSGGGGSRAKLTLLYPPDPPIVRVRWRRDA
jgi:hypothetical protein